MAETSLATELARDIVWALNNHPDCTMITVKELADICHHDTLELRRLFDLALFILPRSWGRPELYHRDDIIKACTKRDWFAWLNPVKGRGCGN